MVPRWSWVVALALLLAAGALLAVLDTVRAQDALGAARQDVALARAAVADGDLAGARDRLADAAEEVATARRSVDGPVWAVGAALPAVGHAPRAVRRIVAVADAAVALAGQALDGADGLVDEDGRLRTGIEDGRVDLAPVQHLADVLAGLPRQDLLTARDLLALTPTSLLPGRVRRARDDALALADEALDQLDGAATAAGVLPSFLGADGPRRYLVALQNPAELRGTGGLIGVTAVLTVDDGAIALSPPSAIPEADEELEDLDAPPVATSDAYTERYGDVGGASILQNANLDPDLPTVAPVLLDLWQARVGDRLDGVVVVDPDLLVEIVRATGPIEVPAAFTADGRIPRRLGPDAALQALTVDAYEVFGGRSDERKAFLEAVATAALGRLLDGGGDPAGLAQALTRAAAGRHVQLHSRDADQARALRRLDLDGALAAPDAGTDLLAVTANNAAANKMDVHVGHAITWDVHLDDVPATPTGDVVGARRAATVALEVANPLPTSGRHEWIIGSARPGEGFGGLTGEPGLNRTWWTVWLPGDGAVLAGRSEQGEVRARTSRIHGDTAVDVTLETPSMSARSVELDVASAVALEVDHGHVRYRARLWRQAKAIPDDLRLVVHAPPGWRVAAAELTGGGDGARPATSEDPRPDEPTRLELVVADDHVEVVGQQTADADLVVTFAPAGRTRGLAPED